MQAQYLNVLISSLSKKVSLVQSIRHSLEKMGIPGKIIGADVNSNCIGKYFVDQFWEMPKLDKLAPHEFVAYCQSQKINLIIPTRDGELLFYAKNKELFLREGIQVMISDTKSIEICLDKLLFYQTIASLGYSTIETTENLEELNCSRYVVKERFGAGSRDVGLGLTKEEIHAHSNKLQNPIFQPFVVGDEISVDLYLARTGKAKGVILRRRELIVDGESQITTTFRNEKLENLCSNLAEELGLYGHVMFQFIHSTDDDVYYLMESNPRFGGASRLSLEVGLDSFYWFFLETTENDLIKYPFNRSKDEKRLIRYAQDFIVTCNTNV